MGHYPDGVDVERQWAISHPALDFKMRHGPFVLKNRHHMTFRISAENHEWYEAALKHSKERLMTNA
eukprot:836072-Prorocentrum_lima.AAC.1